MENVDKNDQKMYMYDYYGNWIIQYFQDCSFINQYFKKSISSRAILYI